MWLLIMIVNICAGDISADTKTETDISECPHVDVPSTGMFVFHDEQILCAVFASMFLKKVKVKETDLYSAFIEVPYTQGAQVRITQCYLQTRPTPYLPLPRKHSPDGASQTEVADI